MHTSLSGISEVAKGLSTTTNEKEQCVSSLAVNKELSSTNLIKAHTSRKVRGWASTGRPLPLRQTLAASSKVSVRRSVLRKRATHVVREL